MNLENLIQIVVTAVTYFLLSYEFFQFSAEVKGRKVPFPALFICFLFVYGWFMIASVLELPLVANWFIFLIILGLEVHIVFSFDFLMSYALAMFFVIMGLAANVFFRSLASILLKVPLNIFDNSMSKLKTYPIFFGFLFMVALICIFRRCHFSEQLKRMLYYRKSLAFYTWTEVFIYLFLMIQLLLYSQSGDTMGTKTWGIKSSLFSAIILVMAVIYSLRVASLHYYMERQHEIRDHLIQEKKDINKLWKLAYTDMLTGCNNRQLLDKRLEEYAGYGGSITLAFIDANGLKQVNDQYGHIEGDNYLISISKALIELINGLSIDLFRYGGDEFVLMSNAVSEEELTKLLNQTNEFLKTGTVHYNRSVSYGVVHGDCSDYHKLLVAADEIMYQHKQKHYHNMIRH